MNLKNRACTRIKLLKNLFDLFQNKSLYKTTRKKMNEVDVLDIQNLPDVPFRRVIFYLSVKDTRNLRLLSKWFERRITSLKKSMFNKFYIKVIIKDNCERINRTLSVAMKKVHAPESLELQFYGEMVQTMRKMTKDYKDKITFLDIHVHRNEDLLLHFLFKSLESLTLNGIGCNFDTMVSVCKVMLDKHAINLKNLTISSLKKNLGVPDLPVLDSLTLENVDEEAACNLLEQSRKTITSFDLFKSNIKSPLLNNADSDNSSVYKIPNIRHLRIREDEAFKFAIYNAEHLLSLELGYIYRGILNDIVWPQFSKLRELSICGSKLMPILMNCRETLERLIIKDINSVDEYFNMKMLKLTDLYIIDGNHRFLSMICNLNKSLEFLFLSDIDLLNLCDSIRMENMRNVVLGYNYPYYTAQDRERMAVMCPNAEVVLLSKENKDEIRDMYKARCKKRNLSLNISRFLL